MTIRLLLTLRNRFFHPAEVYIPSLCFFHVIGAAWKTLNQQLVPSYHCKQHRYKHTQIRFLNFYDHLSPNLYHIYLEKLTNYTSALATIIWEIFRETLLAQIHDWGSNSYTNW
jgi:hypothetical protein